MADLGNLWFSLGLDDSKFEKEWKAALQKYSKQQKIVLDVEITQKTINALQQLKALGGDAKQWKAVREAAKASAELAIAQEKVNTQMAKTQKIQEQINRARQRGNAIGNQKGMTKELQIQSTWLTNLKTMASNYLSLFAAQQVVTGIARISGEFEKQRKTLQAIVGEFEGSDIYNKMQQLAVVSPFKFGDLTSYSKQLAAFSIQYEELYDTTKILADVSAGLGVDMSRIVLAYGQIKNAEVLKGAELRQLTEAGVPILDELAKKLSDIEGRSVSIGEVFTKISQKMISFEMVKDVFEKMTSEGGMFYQMQEIQAETLAGKLSNLADAFEIMVSKIGESQEDSLKGAVDFLYSLMNNYRELISIVKIAASAVISYQGAQLLMFSGQILAKAGAFVTVIGRLHLNLVKAARAMRMLKIASSASFWGIIASAIITVGVAIYEVTQNAKAFNKELDKMFSADVSKLEREKKLLDELSQSIEKTAKGSQDRRDAIEKFNNVFGQYLSNTLKETASANELADAYERVNVAMQNKYRQESIAEAKNKIIGEYEPKIKDEVDKIFKLSSTYTTGLSERIRRELTSYIKALIEADPSKAVESIIQSTAARFGFDNVNTKTPEWLNAIKKLKGVVEEYQQSLLTADEKAEMYYSNAIYDTKAEEEAIKKINKRYEEQEAAIRAAKDTMESDVEDKLLSLRIKKLQELEELYSNPDNKEFFNPKKAQQYNKQWVALVGETEEWAKRIKEVIGDDNALFEFKPGKNELLTDYIDKLNERYKELLEQKKKLKGVKGGEEELAIVEEKLVGIKKVAGINGIKLIDPNAKGVNDALQRYTELFNRFFNNLEVKAAELENQLSSLSMDDIGADEITKELNRIDNEFKKGTVEVEKYKNKLLESWTDVMKAKAKQDGTTFTGVATLEDLPTQAKEAIKAMQDVINKKKELDKAMLTQSVIDNYSSLEKQLADLEAKYMKEFELGFGKEGFDFTKWNESFKNAMYEARKSSDVMYKELFGNLEYMTKERIADAIKFAFSELDKGGLTDEKKQEIISRIQELQAAYRELGEIDITTNITDLIKQSRKLKDDYQNILTLKKDGKDTSALEEIYENEKRNLQLSKGAIAAKGFGDALSLAANSMRELAQATGDAELEKTAENMANMADTISNTVQGFASGGPIGGILAFITSAVNTIVNGFTKAKIYNSGATQSLKEYQQEIDKLKRKVNEDDYDTIFGVDSLKKVSDASIKASKALSDYQDAVNSIFLTNMSVKTEDYSGFANFFGKLDKYTKLKDLAPSLWGEDGVFNVKAAEAFLETSSHLLSEAQRDTIQNVIDLSKAYEENMAILNDYLSDVFSDTASTIAERMMDAFARTGDAATDLGDIVNDVAKEMGQSLIQSLLIDQYLTPAMNKIKGLYDKDSENFESNDVARTQKAIIAIQEGIAAAQAAVPEVNKLLQALEATGIDLATDSESASNVLSGLTEEQQNMLMGYINGIRADVSMNKGILTSIANHAGTISNNIATALIVWREIEANTHRSADGVEKLLDVLEGVVGAYDGGGGQAFRVNIA